MLRDPSVFREGLFADQVALVTGGATGIGLHIAAELRALGAHVAIVSRKGEHLEAGQRALEGVAGTGRVIHHRCNIRETASVEQAVGHVVGELGRVDLLVNNAGGQFPSPAIAMSDKGWDAVIDTNLSGTFRMTRAVVNEAMATQQSGAVVNIIAQMWNGFPMMSHTGAARAGVDNLTKSLGFELAQLGVRVNAVAPGVILSSGVDSYAEAFQQAFHDSVHYIPAGRLGTMREVAAAVVFLLSPAAGFITGTTLRVDGGEPLFGSSSAGQAREHFVAVPPPTHE
jgi:citronellol/citronellal dehydrogenase